MPLTISRIGQARGRPVAQGFGKCVAITRHSASVRSVWYRVTARLCCCRVVGVHMANPSWFKKPLGIMAPAVIPRGFLNQLGITAGAMTQPFSKTDADKSPGD